MADLTEIREITIVTIRSLLAFVALLIMMRFIRKKQLSQYTFYDYVVGITIGSIASTLSVELENRTVSVFWGMLVWAIAPVVLGWIYLKSLKLRKLFDGEPVVLIKDGKILEDNLRKELINLEDLQMQLRSVGVFELAEAEYAVLEKNGQINALKKKEKQPLTLSDLGLVTETKGVPLVLILDGRLMRDTIENSPYSEKWLMSELQKKGIKEISQVVLAQVNASGSLYVDIRDDMVKNLQPDKAPQQIETSLQTVISELNRLVNGNSQLDKERCAQIANNLQNLAKEIKLLLE